MGRYLTTNAPLADGGVVVSCIGNSNAVICGDGRNLCNIGCVWQPIEVCYNWNNLITCWKAFCYNFSCYSMIKFEVNGYSRCDYENTFKFLPDSTNCDLSSCPNCNTYSTRYVGPTCYLCQSQGDIICITTPCVGTSPCSKSTGPITMCFFPTPNGCNIYPNIGGRWEQAGNAGGSTEYSLSGIFQSSCQTDVMCYPLVCCPATTTGKFFNRLRVMSGSCYFGSCQVAVVPGAYYGLWGIPRQFGNCSGNITCVAA